jgi:hypothetical protein
MKKYRVINDTHIFGPLELFPFDELLFKIRSSIYPVILNGDVIDLKNAKKNRVAEAMMAIEFLKKEKCIYIGGNHEMGFGNLPLSHIDGTVYFNHSHLMSNADKYIHWNLKEMEAGAGWFKRHIITPTVDFGRHLKEARPNKEMMKFIENLKKDIPILTHGVYAHAHPNNPIRFVVHGMQNDILCRGVNDISL